MIVSESQYKREEKKKGTFGQEQEDREKTLTETILENKSLDNNSHGIIEEEKEIFEELMIREISDENKQENWSKTILSPEIAESYTEQEVLCDSRAIPPKLTLLDETQKHVFEKMIEKFPHLFSDKPGCSKGYEHKIIGYTTRSTLP